MLSSVAAGTWEPNPRGVALDPYETVTAALWCVVNEASLEGALLRAVMIGGDTDTVAALVGGLLGCQRSAGSVREELSWSAEVLLPDEDLVARFAAGIGRMRTGRSDG